MIVEELAVYLDSQGLAVWDPDGGSGNLFLNMLPDQPDVAVGLYTQPGLAPDVSGNARVRRPGVQLLVRGGPNAIAAAQLARTLQDALHGLTNIYFSPGGTRIMLCAAQQSEPVSLGPDDNGRHEYSINLRLITGGTN